MKKDLSDLKNTFVIGDVHGCYNTLLKLIKQFPTNAKLIFVGDLCDKGKYSKDVIEFVKNNNYLCVKGNHEHLFEKNILDAINNRSNSNWANDKRYGGLQTIQSYNGDIELIKTHLDWIKTLPLYIEIYKYFITHGFALEFYKDKNDLAFYNDFISNRIYEDSIEPNIKEDIINIFGHCVFDEVKIGKKYICLDTGCAKGNKLSAIQLGTNNIFEQKMDPKDSSYILKELKLKDIDLTKFNINQIDKITLDENCIYKEFDSVSNEVLEFIISKYPNNAKEQIFQMKEKSIIFPKQVDKVLN